jgi:hypothetical protein
MCSDCSEKKHPKTFESAKVVRQHIVNLLKRKPITWRGDKVRSSSDLATLLPVLTSCKISLDSERMSLEARSVPVDNLPSQLSYF